jgi:hypothetical protein
MKKSALFSSALPFSHSFLRGLMLLNPKLSKGSGGIP